LLDSEETRQEETSDTARRIARFEGSAAHPENDFTWWTYSSGLYRELFNMLGFHLDRITSAEFKLFLLDLYLSLGALIQ